VHILSKENIKQSNGVDLSQTAHGSIIIGAMNHTIIVLLSTTLLELVFFEPG
jgi:hypothetical protein